MTTIPKPNRANVPQLCAQLDCPNLNTGDMVIFKHANSMSSIAITVCISESTSALAAHTLAQLTLHLNGTCSQVWGWSYWYLHVQLLRHATRLNSISMTKSVDFDLIADDSGTAQ